MTISHLYSILPGNGRKMVKKPTQGEQMEFDYIWGKLNLCWIMFSFEMLHLVEKDLTATNGIF